MNIERLNKMHDLLMGIEPEHFDISSWYDEECGTVGCAVGHACHNVWFKEQGLRSNWYGTPIFQDNAAWNAVQAFFELDEDDAEFLFEGSQYLPPDIDSMLDRDKANEYIDQISPEDVALRIESFIRNEGNVIKVLEENR